MSAGNAPYSLAFSPNGQLLATASSGAHTVSVFAGGDPTAQIISPTDQQTYTQNQTVATSFACTAPAGSAAINSCRDSNNATSPAGGLNTSTLGTHTYTVTATSANTLSSTATIHYAVVAAATPTPTPAPTPLPTTTPAPARRPSSMVARPPASNCTEPCSGCSGSA